MNRDPLYQKIVEALNRPLDGETFERCAVALIGKEHPKLAPWSGGNDAGMDGAFETSQGPYPLICTVSPDVIGNFRDNVSTYLAKRRGPRIAAVATSQRLSNAKKRNLEDEASALGVTIANIYDAAYFADKLYRDSKLRLELLGIAGDPPALSALPRVGRFAQPNVPIGRDEELAWLRQVNGDALVVGHPGSGKTYLHQYLANEEFCLFAVDDSLERLADAIRDQQPSIIVVDDAHICHNLVETLKRLRAELGAHYAIHLNCWPRHEAAVQRILNIPDNRVCRLLPLRRSHVFELIKRMGIHGPDWLQHLLISQADGKPGLAAALADLCKNEDVARIWSGEATAAQLLGDLRLVRDERQSCVLAAFAVGGDWGMPFNRVSEALGISTLELRQIVVGLGSGGLVEEVDADHLQVRPPAIRSVLVRNVFFGGASSLSIKPLLAGIRSAASAASVLMSARQRGAKIEDDFLEELACAAKSPEVWEHFAGIDAHCAATILDKYPEQVCHAAPGLLHYATNRALHALLDADEGDLVPQAGAIEHPRRRISGWLFPFDTEPTLTIERRLLLLDALEERVRRGQIGNGKAFAWALAESLQATFQVVKTSPGNSNEIKCIRGVAAHGVLEQIAALWPRVRELFRHVPSTHARVVFDQLENWCLPQRLSMVSKLSEETREMVRRKGRAMLCDVLQIPHCSRAWRTRAATISKWGRFDLPIEVDPLFDALYTDRDRLADWEQQQDKRFSYLQAQADALMQRPMEEVLQFLADIRTEAIEFGHSNASGYLWVIYQRIATQCDDPAAWLESLVAAAAPDNFLLHFLDRLLSANASQYVAALDRLLERVEYQPIAISRVLRLPTPNDDLLSKAVAILNESQLAEHLWLVDSAIPLVVMKKMLTHPNPRVREAAAIGEWQREPAGSVRPELDAQWRVALRDVAPGHYALNDIFEKQPSLAFEWLNAQLQSGRLYLSMHDQALHTASKLLGKNQRAELLRLFTRDNYDDECFDLVIGEEIDLFPDWFSFQSDKYLRLKPLDRAVGPRWERMALHALAAGASPEDLAHHCLPTHWGGFGPISHHFTRRIPDYEALANHPDPRLRPAGKRGLSFVQGNAQLALERERLEETYVG
jgi:hypothetical protein